MRHLFKSLCTSVLLIAFSAAAAWADGEADASRLTIERIFGSDELKAKSFALSRWREDASGYEALERSQDTPDGRDLVSYCPKTGRRTVLVPAWRLVPTAKSKPLAVADYSWSDDRSKLLIFTNTRRVWRRHTRGDYWVLELGDWKLHKLGGDAPEATLMFAKLSPDGTRVGYVCRNNLYVQDLDDYRVTPLTTDGSATIINGTSDWVYEEEFGLRDGFRFSPDGRSIAYWQFDSSGVGVFRMINTTDSLYPTITAFRHAKVGQTNSACRVGVVGVEGGKTRWFKPSDDPRNHYVPELQWAADSRQVVFQQLNRLQNTLEVIFGDARSGSIRTVFTDRDKAWIDVHGELTWLGGDKSFLYLSERDGWRHLYRVAASGKRVTLLTPGEFDVISLQRVDRQRGWVYFIASPENPTQRYLYCVKADGGGRRRRVTPADQSGTHSYRISPDGRWAFHTWSNINTPPITELVRLPSHKTVRVLEDNAELRARIAKLGRRPTEMFRVDIGGGVMLDGWCMKPADFDPGKKYPLLFHVYGEPAGQSARDRWGVGNSMWHALLTQQGYIVANLDNRGTPAPRGRAWRKCIYRQVGILASADQAAATRALIKRWPYVDPKRIGIWGASGGGSMSLNAIFRYPDLYSTAMALSFISDQRLYDTIYQERYMGLPDDNEEGYTNGSPITFAHQLEGNLLLVHGTGDDNCHFQSCERLVNELVEHNKQFSVMFYPNRTHSLGGGNTRRHLYEMMTRFLQNNMPPGTEKDE